MSLTFGRIALLEFIDVFHSAGGDGVLSECPFPDFDMCVLCPLFLLDFRGGLGCSVGSGFPRMCFKMKRSRCRLHTLEVRCSGVRRSFHTAIVRGDIGQKLSRLQVQNYNPVYEDGG